MPIQGYEFKVLEKKLTCPFNPAHQVTDMQKHLTRCSLYNSSGVHVKKCPFNATHWVKAPEFKSHLDNCEDRAPIDRHILAQISGTSGNSGDLSMPLPYSAREPENVVVNHEPGWDDEDDEWNMEVANLPTHLRQKYDPLHASRNREIFRHPTEHRGRSGRNKYREETNARMESIRNGSEVAETASSTLAPSVATTVRRRPTTNPICIDQIGNVNPNLGLGRARRPVAVRVALPVEGAAGGAGAGGDGAAAAAAGPQPPPQQAAGRGRGMAMRAVRPPGQL